MRIIIEDTGSFVHGPPSSQGDPISLEDGGAAPGTLLQLLAGASTRLPASQPVELQDAGPPPAWLVDAISRAFEGDPGRFEFRSPAAGELEPIPDAVDGGSAPDLGVK
jgi:hypothetical protein